jgi:hypothetical protein
MKSIRYLIGISFLLAATLSCKKDINDDIFFVETAGTAANLTALFEITQDNSGLVTITPNGEGAISYDVYYGDGTTTPAKVQASKNTTHKYAEGVYNVKIVGYNITGKSTEVTKQLTVSFRAPENLDFTITKDPNNNFKVSITASALYETNFKVYFGVSPSEIPVTFIEGDVVNFIYPAVGTYQIRVVAFSGGAATTQLIKPVTITDPIVLPLTFESSTINYAFSNFDGGVVAVINNPQSNGINTSAKVSRMVKNAGQPWGGSLITMGSPIDFSINKVFRMKVFSPRVGAKVLLKVENLTNGGIAFEKEVLTTMANVWEDLAFDYRTINTANSYQKIVIIFDNGIMGDGSANFTFLFDDIRLTNQMPVGLLALPVTFDLSNVNYEVTDFGGNVSEAAVDPTNAGNKVKKSTKTPNAETWAGTTMGAGFTSAIPFTSSQTQMSVKVYSPAAGIRVRLKIEDRNNNTRSVETEAMTQAANIWETLVFDFANQSAGTAALNLSFTYDMASIFFDFGKDGDGKVFFWDDVQFLTTNVTPNYLILPLTFQSTTYGYPFVDFDGGVATVVNNPNPSGINTSTEVGKMVKNAGQVWGGSLIELVNPINFSTSKIIKVKVYSPRIGAKLLLKVEGNGAPFEKEVATTMAGVWEELTFDYSAINTGLSYYKIVLIFDLGTMGDGSANFTYYFDDIRLN